jgi:hypothetical protein
MIGLIFHATIAFIISLNITNFNDDVVRSVFIFLCVYAFVCFVGYLIRRIISWWPDPLWGLSKIIEAIAAIL